jgi:hypothetical protein
MRRVGCPEAAFAAVMLCGGCGGKPVAATTLRSRITEGATS